ncbi:MAG: lysophospholipid acyltransferase family protein [Desulfobacterium sp.]|nr:lysophospholipid acyltransferase family protein [Desulfobacterium sp.]
MGWISLILLKLVGWRVESDLPDTKKMVIIAAPHTSNWDLPYTLFTAFVLRMNIYWMGKEAIFKKPFRKLFMWLGGIPIDRSCANSIVSQSIEQFILRDRLALAIAPAGTRTKVSHWKTGFYHIAVGADVPIALGFLDYKRKISGFGPLIHPTGNLEADMERIRAFYKNITGKYPEKSTNSAKIKK